MERAAKQISKSMMSYLKRAREHKEFLLKETKEFERSKRHLANMMGLDSKEMTQDDIDEAIKYLFPSGLFIKSARPIMKHPDLIFKVQKDAQFDIEGRPYHHLFYTVLPNYYEALSDIGRKLRELDKYEDEQIAKGNYPAPEDSYYTLSGKEWLGYEAMCDKFIETITRSDYDYLIRSLNQILKHPYSITVKDFVDEFADHLKGQSLSLNLPEVKKDEKTGELYTEIRAQRRDHVLDVKTILNGTGKIDIDGHDILYFSIPHMRRAIWAPLRITEMQDQVDIIARFVRKPIHIGEGAVAGAVRYAVSLSLAAHSDEETRRRLRLAGLLEIDMRRKERKKPGQEGARRKYTWKRR